MVVIKARHLIGKMKKKAGLVATLSLSVLAAPSQQPPAFKKDTLKKTEIALLYSHYMQDGNHSAVTGGTGTEELTVYAPQIQVKRTNLRNQSWTLKGGADVITSASTDNINFVKSSASLMDVRAYLDVGFAHQPTQNEWELSYGTGLSVESDYLSFPFRIGLNSTGRNKPRTYLAEASLFFDDLRWGRFDDDYYRPAKLIYPSELRDTVWHEEFSRQSYNLKLGITQVINKRWVLGLFPAVIYQRGLLATPFHRVYFSNGSAKVENLPAHRVKLLLGLKANAFIGGRTIFKQALDLYRDSYGITGLAIDIETAIKLNARWTVMPFFRVYFQHGADYFAPHQQHDLQQEFYTSDYDLSGFSSFKPGLSVRYAPYRFFAKNLNWEEVRLRYAWYARSDGLRAHLLTVVFQGTAFSSSERRR